MPSWYQSLLHYTFPEPQVITHFTQEILAHVRVDNSFPVTSGKMDTDLVKLTAIVHHFIYLKPIYPVSTLSQTVLGPREKIFKNAQKFQNNTSSFVELIFEVRRWANIPISTESKPTEVSEKKIYTELWERDTLRVREVLLEVVGFNMKMEATYAVGGGRRKLWLEHNKQDIKWC